MKSQSYNTFWQRIHQSAREKAYPLRVMFELTYRCNFKCRHCYVPYNYRKKEALKTKEVFSVLDQLAKIGCFYLGFTGGEPFMRKDILDILWYAKKKGFEIIIYTNGSLINEEIVQELQRLKPNKVDITIPAISKNAFERITQMPGSHKKVFKAIDLLHKRGINLGFKTCVLKENESEIKAIQDSVVSLGALHRLDDMLSRSLDGSKEPYKYRGVLVDANYRKSSAIGRSFAVGESASGGALGGNAKLRECLNDANHREYNANSRESFNRDISVNSRTISENSRLFKCGVGVSQAAITPLGELKMCLMIDYPKYKILDTEVVSRMLYVVSDKSEVRGQRTDLKEAWKRLKELVVFIKPDENYKCNQCQLEPYCKWCPAQAWLENKSFTTCDPESRRWAEIRSQKEDVIKVVCRK